MKLKRILFPVDFSERARAVAPYISALARRYNAQVTLATFVELAPVWFGAAEVPVLPEVSLPRLIEESEHNLAFFAGEHFKGLSTRIVVEQGEAARGVVDLVRTSEIDLVAMPTHGRGKVRAALLGSTTAKVLHDTDCPVWTAAHLEAAGYKASTSWNKIVVAVETTKEALPILKFAAGLAADGSAIQLVHAVPSPPEVGPERYFERDFDVFLKDSAKKSIDQLQREAGTAFPLTIETGDISPVITAAARASTADLIMIGRGVISHVAGRLRTNVYSIIRDAPCPVLSV